ncbi:hypothetical protein EYF80_055164 [Liparis tanakae]|uniref:Uncharacterized protein n=1 Tax=Liparis tanakae TaxID=230148 RepID=A0A4Z2F1N6_9TELE|nr:hypothetical protein EYF80_055164 [Liparis tanakae]
MSSMVGSVNCTNRSLSCSTPEQRQGERHTSAYPHAPMRRGAAAWRNTRRAYPEQPGHGRNTPISSGSGMESGICAATSCFTVAILYPPGGTSPGIMSGKWKVDLG